MSKFSYEKLDDGRWYVIEDRDGRFFKDWFVGTFKEVEKIMGQKPTKQKPALEPVPEKRLTEFEEGALWAHQIFSDLMQRHCDELRRVPGLGADAAGLLGTAANLIQGLKIECETAFMKGINKKKP